MSPEERDELAALYAVGALDEKELVAFEQALKTDPTLGDLVAKYEAAATGMALSLPAQAAPGSLRDKVLQAVEERSPSRPVEATKFSLAWVPWALAAALAVFCGLSVVKSSNLTAERTLLAKETAGLREKISQLHGERDQLQGRVNALLQEKADLDVRVASLEKREPLREIQNVSLAPQAEAPDPQSLTALWDASRRMGVLDLAGLPAPPSDKDYQLWVIPVGSSTPVDGGILTAAVGARAIFEAPQGVTEVAALAISLEPKGGSVAARGPIIYVGKM